MKLLRLNNLIIFYLYFSFSSLSQTNNYKNWENILVIENNNIYLFSDSIFKNECISHEFWSNSNKENINIDYVFYGKIIDINNLKLSVKNNATSFFTCDTTKTYKLIDSTLSILNHPKTEFFDEYDRTIVDPFYVFNNLNTHRSIQENNLENCVTIHLKKFKNFIEENYPNSTIYYNRKSLSLQDSLIVSKESLFSTNNSDKFIITFDHFLNDSNKYLCSYSYLISSEFNNYNIKPDYLNLNTYNFQNINKKNVRINLINHNKFNNTVKIKFGDFTKTFNYYDKRTEFFINTIFDAEK